MTKATTLKVVEGAPPEPPGETPLSPARARLAQALAARPGLAGEQAAIDAALGRLGSLMQAEQRAAAAVSSLEADAATRAIAWAKGADAALSLPDGADLKEARALLAQAQASASAARSAEPTLMGEQQATLSRRNALESSIKLAAADVLIELGAALAGEIAERERELAGLCARLAATRRPIARLKGQSGAKTIAEITGLLDVRRVDEPAVPALEASFQQLADALLADATATLET